MKLQEVLPILKSEVEIQEHYQRFIEENFKGCLPFRKLYREFKIESDGILEHNKLGLKILSEFKYKIDILDRKEFCKCLIQVLFYLKKIERIGERFPNIIFIANEIVCYCFHSEYLLKYLDFPSVDWNVTPSSAWQNNIELLNTLIDDQNISYYPFHTTKIDLKEVIDSIISLNIGVQRKVKINMKNIERFFNEFINRVVIKANHRFNANELVGIFMNIINYQDDIFLHPKKKNILVVKNIEVPVNLINYNSFFSHVHEVYTPKEGDDLNAICDRLIHDLDRRFKGEFYTPTIWVDESHRMICKEYGPNWYEEYVVWDPGWGTGNLTRDYNFKELYCSTINESDLKIGEKYNPNAVKFQYDFLNDYVYPEGLIGVDQVEDKLTRMAPGLVKALRENRKIIIFMNPPYGSSGELRKELDKKIRKGIAKNKINELMLSSGMARASLQLYAQFLFRIINLSNKYKNKNISICLFVPPAILSTSSFKNLRSLLFDMVEFKNGMIFKAGHFSNVQDTWPISFLLFSPGKETRNEFNLIIKDLNKEFTVINLGNKVLYNPDNLDSAATWVREEIKNKKFNDAPRLKSALHLSDDGRAGKFLPNAIGFIYYSGNIVSESLQRVSIFSSTSSVEYNGFPIIPENFHKIVSIFTARKCSIFSWFNMMDEYIKPNITDDMYNQFVFDSTIYSIFSEQSSLRNITYKNKQWNIFNEFFWLSNQFMMDLANQHSFTELYEDAKTFNKDRFVYNELQKVLPQLSPDAVAVLNKANELVVKSFVERKNLYNIHPEWHLEAWDAGWYQIKLVLKESFPDDLKEFRLLYRAFENRMREGVYKFGFLK